MRGTDEQEYDRSSVALQAHLVALYADAHLGPADFTLLGPDLGGHLYVPIAAASNVPFLVPPQEAHVGDKNGQRISVTTTSTVPPLGQRKSHRAPGLAQQLAGQAQSADRDAQ